MARYLGYVTLALSLMLLGCPAQESEEEFTLSVEENASSEDLADDDGVLPEDLSEEENTPPEGLTHLETFLGHGLRLPASLDSNDHESLRQVHQAYALSEYRRLGSDADNIAISVIDKQLLLGMTALGATGTTLEAVSDASGLAVADELPHAMVNDWDQYLVGLSGMVATRYFWGQERYLFADDYLENIAQFYGPEMMAIDFQAAAADSAIQVNAALTDQFTVTAIDDRTRIVMAQSVEVDQAWSPTLATESFRGRFVVDGDQYWVDMVRLDGLFNVAETDQYRAVEVPLSDPELALLIIEPNVSFHTLKNSFDQTMFQSIMDQLSPQQTVVKLPVFEVEKQFVNQQVADLGVAAIDGGDPVPASNIYIMDEDPEPSQPVEEVSDNEANFYPVNKTGYLYLSDIKQKVGFVLTQEGLSAVAASAVAHRAKQDEPDWLLSDDAAIWEFEDDTPPGGTGLVITTPGSDNQSSCYYPADQRPFLFVLYAPASGTLVAVGHVSDQDGERVAADWTVARWQECGNSPPIEIYQYTGEIQCQSSGVDLYTMMDQLLNAGIEVLEWGWGTDGLFYPSVCGSGTGNINRFTIREQAFDLSQQLGFSPISELEAPTW